MKNKNKKLLSTKAQLLFGGSLAFLFSLSCSVTATLAWYTINDVYQVNHLNVKFLSTGEKLELGIRDENGDVVFKDEYTSEELGFGDAVLDEVSGMYSSEWLEDTTIPADEKFPVFRSSYRGNIDHRKTRVAEDGYVQKEFFLRSTQKCSLYLNDTSYFVPNLDANAVTATTYGLNADELNQVVNAVRVSFYTEDNYVIANPGNSEETYYGGLLDLNLDGYYDYDSLAGEEICYGEVLGDVVYKDQIDESSPLSPNYSTFNGNHKDNVSLVDLEKTQIQKENSVKLDEICLNLEDGDSPYSPICVLEKDEVKRVVVSIYLEGWDRHTVDSIQRASFDACIDFAALYNL